MVTRVTGNPSFLLQIYKEKRYVLLYFNLSVSYCLVFNKVAYFLFICRYVHCVPKVIFG